MGCKTLTWQRRGQRTFDILKSCNISHSIHFWNRLLQLQRDSEAKFIPGGGGNASIPCLPTVNKRRRRRSYASFTLRPLPDETVSSMMQREWPGVLANLGNNVIKTVDIFGNHAEILKWECEMVSLPKVRITIIASLMNTTRTGLRSGCCCIHKHFFRTHNNPWALFWGHTTLHILVVHVGWQWLKRVKWMWSITVELSGSERNRRR